MVQIRDFNRFDEVIARNVVDHDPEAGQPPGLDGIKWYWRNFTTSFPDFRAEIDVLTAGEDHVTMGAPALRHTYRRVPGPRPDRTEFLGPLDPGLQVRRRDHRRTVGVDRHDRDPPAARTRLSGISAGHRWPSSAFT
jgi:hypothetical protein